MNRLVIIGNGFDLAHGLKTSYKDFIYWYWKKRLGRLVNGHTSDIMDGLCTLKLNPQTGYSRYVDLINIDVDFFQQTGKEFFNYIKNNDQAVTYDPCPLMRRICTAIENKGWVDIEREYFEELTTPLRNIGIQISNTHNPDYTNLCLELIRRELCEYLAEVTNEELKPQEDLLKAITCRIYEQDISNEDKHKIQDYYRPSSENEWNPKKIMLLDFNYTGTTGLYAKDDRVTINHIHGSLDDPSSIIFGYGDELDENNERMQYGEYREYLKHAKSLNYMESSAYQDMLSFANEAEFQILIMGHSCGLSDRTLLNTLFEHRNCISIKPYIYRYQQENRVTHQIEDKDNFTDLIQDIYRNFKDKALFRSRVMNKTRCGWM